MFDDLPFKGPGEGNKPAGLKLYALSDCGHCRQAMAFLDGLGIPYRYLHVDLLPPELRIMIKKQLSYRYQSNLVFPMLELPGEDFVFGFEESAWKPKLAALGLVPP